MNRVKFSRLWKKRLAASLLPLSMLLAAPADVLPQTGQSLVSAAAAQAQAADDQESAAAGATEEQLNALNEARALLRAQYGENKQITDGKAGGTADGVAIRGADTSGGSFRGELGATMQPDANSPWSLDFNVAGFAGKKRGFTGGVSVAFMF